VPLTVLVVDDYPDFRLAARMMLESVGYRVVAEADCGAEALRLGASARPDLILLDIELPDMDGFAVSRELVSRFPTLVVVLCSVRDGGDYHLRARACGARGFVGKSTLSPASFARATGGS
jgi:two-component system chemotaxis response regulator CheY